MSKRNSMKSIFILWFVLVPIVGIYFISKMDPKLFPSGAVLLSATLGLSAALAGMFYQRQTAKEKNTLDFQQKLKDDKDYLDHVVVLGGIIHSLERKQTLLELAKPENSNDSRVMSIRYVLNTWEQAANAIRHKLYDEAFLYSSHKSSVIDLSLHLRPFIRERQKKNISLYSDFSLLALKWTIERDSFESLQTKKELKRIFKQLDRVKSGKISPTQK
ncbi:DUF4760 domain-containing protein [Pseudoalteromonas sp. APC 3224]|uniref:DUF4760 domain-containing protein n=1 Tax=Pseudoalteromonas sp. APC 3224 TaxID=3035203 RepID=UPI0025B4C695|nr:DUF4760 domain-containing protein [Pseudoalteromonas sp. APC 3224]MDN3485906.1 DUF4760 domain-containing protein [Pseudoalteromonas sp. APC 3224]